MRHAGKTVRVSPLAPLAFAWGVVLESLSRIGRSQGAGWGVDSCVDNYECRVIVVFAAALLATYIRGGEGGRGSIVALRHTASVAFL